MKYKSVINPCTYDIRREYRRITWLKEENFGLRAMLSEYILHQLFIGR